MTNYHVQPMTLEEKQNLINLLEDTALPETLGDGVSLFDDDRWLGGMVFNNTYEPRAAGGFIAEIQGTGLWIQCAPIMWAKMFEYRGIFFMESANSAVLNVIKKLGTIDVEQTSLGERVWYEKKYTTQYLGPTVNTDFLGLDTLPPKAMSKSINISEAGTEIKKSFFIQI